ncbi:FecR domain-containing protein [Cytophagaceae bacterium YF14B1]|uniref:FecR domain-containing protein n=1 Tax=Xanthocytophaga flava TaxID=3048013 RepID=A0AAE3U7K0_9BACT|nr:FecR domain-containing protein [Xanthocytophaga flavus]MDJ1479749.1 FecR domain-containing protein [Xanthocytophaga flavus]
MENEPNIVVTDELIARYLAGEADPMEAIAIDDWQENSLENQLYFQQMRAAWQATRPERNFVMPDIDQDWKILDTLLDQPADSSKTSNERTLTPEVEKPVNSNWFLRVAASVLIVLGIGAIFYWIGGKPRTREMASVSSHDAKILEQRLPDNSHVVLSAHSTLTYAKNFEGDTREVKLTGEAYFQVTPNKLKPFIIHTDKAEVKVVGTAFNVDATGNAVVISVTSGKVQLSAADTSVYLVKGQTGTWQKNSRIIEVTSVVNTNALGYATHMLEFKETPLKMVISDIEKMYACKISLKNNNLADCKFSSIFDNSSLDEVLGTLKEYYSNDNINLEIVKVGPNEFSLEGGKCPYY